MGKGASKSAYLPAPHRPGSYRKLSLYTATFNVAEQSPCADDMSAFCGLVTRYYSEPQEQLKCTAVDEQSNGFADIIVLGLQEQMKSEEWVQRMKECLVPKGYCVIKYRKSWSISLIVFIKFMHLEAVQNIESEVTRSGLADVMGDKGAVSIRFDIYGINMIIVCVHLSAHLHENKERLADFWDAMSRQRFRDPDVNKILDHDFIFLIGNLNFRINGLDKNVIEQKIADGDLKSLLLKDQLKSSLVDSGIFDEFEEGEINFKPTFKFDHNTDQYDSSKKQLKPAWTDRVLYKSNQTKLCEKNLKINLIEYNSLEQYKFSDHRPVSARFILTVPETPPVDPVHFINWSIKKCRDNSSFMKAVVRYRLTRRADPKFSARAGDGIRLYKVPFSDFEDTVVRTAAAAADSGLAVEDLQVTIRFNTNVVSEEDQLMLVYWSTKKNCPATCSPQFQLKTN